MLIQSRTACLSQSDQDVLQNDAGNTNWPN